MNVKQLFPHYFSKQENITSFISLKFYFNFISNSNNIEYTEPISIQYIKNHEYSINIINNIRGNIIPYLYKHNVKLIPNPYASATLITLLKYELSINFLYHIYDIKILFDRENLKFAYNIIALEKINSKDLKQIQSYINLILKQDFILCRNLGFNLSFQSSITNQSEYVNKILISL